MDLSLDTLKETVFDYNSDFFIDMFEQVRQECRKELWTLDDEKHSYEFIQIILNNIHLYDTHDDEDDFISD
jgi:hypothetical protein